MRLSAAAERTLKQAGNIAIDLGHSFVGTVHILLSLSRETGTVWRVLRQLGFDEEIARMLVQLRFGCGQDGLPLPQGFTPNARRLIDGGGREAENLGSQRVEPEHLLLSLARQENTQAMELLWVLGIDGQTLFSLCAEDICVKKRCFYRKKEVVTTKLLEQFSEDLIAKAAEMEPVIGRDREIDTVIGVLCRKHKNNPALIGEPGVGKTAIAEGLAQRMAAGNVPQQLREKRLMSLNMASLVAGTKYRGEFEERLREVISELKRCPEIILFVDEMHTIVGAGAAEGAIDAANIFKPALGRGEIQMLGATTREEYRKYIEKDAALERRFRPIAVEEPDEETALEILKALGPGLEKHHRLRISQEAMSEAVRLSVRYLPDRYLPDKAIDLLDEAAARASMGVPSYRDSAVRRELEEELKTAVQQRRYEQAAELRDKVQKLVDRIGERRPSRCVTAQDIAWVVSARTGIPVGKLTTGDRQRLLELEDRLTQRVLGQSKAVAAAAEAVRRGSVDIRDANRPVASLLFTGPTGVGKTELCRALAEEVYGSQNAMIRLDMTEFSQRATASRLIGAPPGYVGYEEGGKLTEAVRRRPYCLVLLDELEKADSEVLGLLLQIMEEGELTDATGRKVSFRNAIVVMTSNAGGEVKGESLGFCGENRENQVVEAAKKFFSPEFLGRLDGLIAFEPLKSGDMESIAGKFINQLRKRTQALGIELVLPKELAANICRRVKGMDGARQLRRLVQTEVEGRLSSFLLTCPEKPETVTGRLREGELTFSC